jgi:hypothetical protein
MAINAALSSFSYAGTVVGAVGNVSVNMTRSALETTEIGSAAQSYIAGVGGATASLELFVDMDVAEHKKMIHALNTASAAVAVVFTLEPAVGTGSASSISGTAFVTSFKIDAGAGSVLKASVEFQFTTASPGSTIVTILPVLA